MSDAASEPCDPPRQPSANYAATLFAGYLVIATGLGGFGVWAGTARLDGAAIAPGVVSSESNRKTVQHLEGGIVREILVRDGAQVSEGQVLIRLDPTRADAQGDLHERQVINLRAQEARLEAEGANRSEVSFPKDLRDRSADLMVGQIMEDQQRQFTARREAMLRNVGIGKAQMEQIRKELEQGSVELATSRDLLASVVGEVEPLRPLARQGLVPATRVNTLERERLRLEGAISAGEVLAKKLHERMAETTLRIQQMVQGGEPCPIRGSSWWSHPTRDAEPKFLLRSPEPSSSCGHSRSAAC
jgi:HlyD family type I secretion membrane fusion protein